MAARLGVAALWVSAALQVVAARLVVPTGPGSHCGCGHNLDASVGRVHGAWDWGSHSVCVCRPDHGDQSGDADEAVLGGHFILLRRCRGRSWLRVCCRRAC